MLDKETQFWNERYSKGGNSGYGSYDDQLERKLRLIKGNIEEVYSISEYGCGDFNFGKRVMELFPNAQYNGTDISEFIINRNRDLFPFANFTTFKNLPKADLVMCVDVLFHIFEPAEVDNLLSQIENSFTKYLVMTAYERDEDLNSYHVSIKKFDPQRFGTPIVREIIEEDGSLYIYIWEK